MGLLARCSAEGARDARGVVAVASGAGLDCGDLFVHVAVRSAVRYCVSSHKCVGLAGLNVLYILGCCVGLGARAVFHVR